MQFEIMQLHRKLDELPATVLAQVREMSTDARDDSADEDRVASAR
jgi:hypothetical protein